MKNVRRIYFYLVAFISLEVVVWGLIGLLRTIFSTGIAFQGADTLSRALALILVGVPIFGLHWVWAQRSLSDEEEQVSLIRGVFLYATLLSTLIPVVQNVLALVNRGLIQSSGISSYYSFVGGSQSTVDNLIAVVLNLLVATYFYRVLTIPDYREKQDVSFTEIFRLYSYVWVLYSLFLTIFGIQEVVRFIFYQPGIVIGPAGKEYFLNGLAMLTIGTPVWLYSWNHRQNIDQNKSADASIIRLVFLFALSTIGITVVLAMSSLVAYNLLMPLLGESATVVEVLSHIGNPISVGLPLCILWFYYGNWFTVEVANRYTQSNGRAVTRLRKYLLSFIGLTALIVSLILLVGFFVNLTLTSVLWGESLRSKVAGSIAAIISALPLWVLSWSPMQSESRDDTEIGAEARGSVTRRVYLYIGIFSGVVGGMVYAIILVNTLLFGLLDHTDSTFVPNLIQNFGNLLVFLVILIYHLQNLTKDHSYKKEEDATAAKAFKVVILEMKDDGVQKELVSLCEKNQYGVALLKPSQISKDDYSDVNVLIVDSHTYQDQKLVVKLADFSGEILVIPSQLQAAQWVGIHNMPVREVEFQLRNLLQGKGLKPYKPTSAWQTVTYVMAVIFGLQLLFVVFGLIMSLVAGG